MAVIHIPRRWTTQPQGATQIEWGNPFANSLEFAQVGTTPYLDLAANRRASQISAIQEAGPSGVGPALSGTNHIQFPNDAGLEIVGNLTVLWMGVFNTTSTYHSLASNAVNNASVNSPFDVWVGFNLSSLTRADASSSTQWRYDSSVVNRVGENAYAISHVLGQNPIGIANGTEFNTFVNFGSAGITPTASGQPLRIGRRADGGNQLNGIPYLVLIWRRALSRPELRSIYDAPWQLFRPRIQRVFSLPAVGNTIELSSASFQVSSSPPDTRLTGSVLSETFSMITAPVSQLLSASLTASSFNVDIQGASASLQAMLAPTVFNSQGEAISVGGNTLGLEAAIFPAVGGSFDGFLSAPLGASVFNAQATDVDFPTANQIILTNVLFNTAAEDYQQALGASLGTTTVLVSSTEFTNTLRATLTNTVVKWTAHALDIPFVLSLDDLTLNDVIAVKLAALGFTGSINDKLLQFFLANGATTNKLRDAEKEWLLTKTAAKVSVVDMYEDYFDSLGFVGNINEKMKAFFKSL